MCEENHQAAATKIAVRIDEDDIDLRLLEPSVLKVIDVELRWLPS